MATARPAASASPGRPWGRAVVITGLLLACAEINPAFKGEPVDGSPPPPPGGSGGGSVMAGSMSAAGAAGSARTMIAGAPGSGFGFETGTETWHEIRDNPLELLHTTAKAASGSGSIEARIQVTSGDERYVGLWYDPHLLLPAGSTLRAKVWVPSNAPLNGVQPFVLYFPPGSTGAKWAGKWHTYGSLAKDRWTEVSFSIPANDGIVEMGVQFQTSSAWTGSVWIDDVTW